LTKLSLYLHVHVKCDSAIINGYSSQILALGWVTDLNFISIMSLLSSGCVGIWWERGGEALIDSHLEASS
jgi:hypothetical protein